VHSIKAYRGRRGTAPLILKLGSINRKLCAPHSWSGCFGAVKDLLLLPGIEPWIIEPEPWSVDCLYCSDSTTVCSAACSIAHSIICTRLFHGKMHSDWFDGIEILKADGSMEKKWDTVIPVDLKRLFVSRTYMFRWSRKG
jgi:hypothetical protein